MSNERDERGALLAPLADAYEPTGADERRVLASIQGALAAGATVASSATVRAEPARAPAPAPAPATAGKGKKLLFAGLSCAAIATFGGLALRTSDSGAVGPAPRAETASVDVAPSAERAEPEGTPAIPSISIDALPEAGVKPVNPPAPSVAPAAVPVAPAADADTLEREARILADARRARQADDAERALGLLDQHAREFPMGLLASDRAAERIVVLCALGRRAEASREAEMFLKGRPKGPLTRRVEMSCAGKP